MRVAVIRGDLPGPVFLADLEAVSQYNPPTEPIGQQKGISRPTSATFGAVMALYNPATIGGTADITFPLTINAGNQTLKVKSAAVDPYSTVLIPMAVYANITTLLAAINSVLPATFVAVPLGTSPSLRLALQTVAKGATVRIQNDTIVGGSTCNTALGLPNGLVFTVPTAAAGITATIPIGGPINVSPATIRTTFGTGLTSAQWTALQNALAPLFIETDVALKSFQVGMLQDLRNAAFNPDPARMPPITPSAAIAVVADDGSTPFTAPLPTLSNAQYNTPIPGWITLTGTGLAGPGSPNSEVVETHILFGTQPDNRHLEQAIITRAGGTVSATSIVIPASVVPAGAGIGVGTWVIVRYTSLRSNRFTLV